MWLFLLQDADDDDEEVKILEEHRMHETAQGSG